ncbi:MAG: hypothetical protein K0R08_1508 [Solimicrobium sp.]|nr:hypothetical protein [Solimicrobium sp.]
MDTTVIRRQMSPGPTRDRPAHQNSNSAPISVISTANELKAFVGEQHYDPSQTFGQNVLHAIEGDFFPTQSDVTLMGCTFALDKNHEIEIPRTVTLGKNCFVVSGGVNFYQGELNSSARGAGALAWGDDAIANATAAGAQAGAMESGAIAVASVAGSQAIAMENGAIANASAAHSVAFAAKSGAVANAAVAGAEAAAFKSGATANATVANAEAHAMTNGAVADATATGATAQAWESGAIANATVAGAQAIAVERGAIANANVAGAQAFALANSAVANATIADVEAVALESGATANATVAEAHAFAYRSGTIANATATGAIVEAWESGATTNATITGARALAMRSGAIANATATGAIAEAWGSGATANATIAGAGALAMGSGAIANATAAGAMANANVAEAIANLLVRRAIASRIAFETDPAIHWNAYLEHRIRTKEEENKVLYEKPDGVKDNFSDQEPNVAQIMEINSCISKNLEKLKNQGMVRDRNTIFLTNARDCVSLEDFEPAEQVEWCLLGSSDNHFDLIKKSTAENLINKGNNHPLMGRSLQVDDIVRGEKMLNLIR